MGDNYVDVFDLLNQDVDSKELEKEYEVDKQRRWNRKPEHSWANWLTGFLIYFRVIVKEQPWRAQSLGPYLDLIYRAYVDFPGHTWLIWSELSYESLGTCQNEM